jgi:hypothetical protein
MTGAHRAVRGSGHQAARAAGAILARNDVPATAHQFAAQDPPQQLLGLVAQLMNRHGAALSHRRAAHRGWLTATRVQARGHDQSYTRDRGRDHGPRAVTRPPGAFQRLPDELGGFDPLAVA